MEQSDCRVLRVLLVDERENDYLLTRSMLSQAQGRKFVLDWAPTYRTGQEYLRANHYDAVLVEYDLGPQTGIEFIRETTALGYRAPLILYAGLGSYDMDVEVMHAGAAFYIIKEEANPLLLERVIRYAIERKGLEQKSTDLLESIQDGFFAIDRDWRITYINLRAAQNIGLEPEGLVGQNIWETFPRLLGTPVEQYYRRVMEERKAMRFEMQGVYQSRWYSISVYPYREGISIYWQDIIEQKRIEENIRFSEERFSKAFNATPDALVISRLADGQIELINDSFEQLFGFSRAEVIGKTSLQLNMFAEPADRAEIVKRIREAHSLRDIETVIRIRSGEKRQANLSIEILPVGSEVYILTIIEDVTERKQAEEALRESERQQRELVKSLEMERARLAAVLDNLPVGIWIADGKGQLIGKNEQVDQIWAGDAPLVETIENYSQYVAWYPESGKTLLPEEYPVAIALRTGQPVEPVELKIRRLDGTEGTVLVSAAPVKDSNGQLTGAVGVNVDITARRKAEEALAEREQMLRLAVTASNAGAWSWDLDTNTLQWSDEYYRIFGFEPGSIEPSTEAGFSRIHPEDLAHIEALVSEAIARGTQIDVVHRVIWPDGSVRWVRGIARAFYDGQGRPVRMAGIAIDITEQKQAEIELQAAHRRTAEILESISDAFYSLDREGHFTYVNQKAASLWGKQPAELLGKNIWEVFPSGKETESYTRLNQAMKDQEPAHYESYSRFLNQWVNIHLYPTEQGISVFFQDITERKQAEAMFQLYTRELERSNRDLQEFAFVASHDMQEPLRKIEALGDMILEGSANFTEQQQDQLARMRKSAGRMRKMVDGMLQLSRLTTHAHPFQLVDLHQITQDVLSDLELQIQSAGGIVEAGELPVIEADPLQMRRLIQNLIGNALKFQPPGGKPQIKVFSRQPTPETVQILVQDNGIGFDQELADRIFQPFKRLVGKTEYEGSGIGLAISRRIVERHGGNITAHSKMGHGATFIVTLPIEQNDSRH